MKHRILYIFSTNTSICFSNFISLFTACGIKYCLECDVQGRCDKCRNGSLLNEDEHVCVGKRRSRVGITELPHYILLL